MALGVTSRTGWGTIVATIGEVPKPPKPVSAKRVRRDAKLGRKAVALLQKLGPLGPLEQEFAN